MEKRTFQLSSMIRNSFLLQKKGVKSNAAPHIGCKAKENSRGQLVVLYKDMEACGGYEDIQVMWEMIHASSSPPNVDNIPRRKRIKSWKFCFFPQVCMKNQYPDII